MAFLAFLPPSSSPPLLARREMRLYGFPSAFQGHPAGSVPDETDFGSLALQWAGGHLVICYSYINDPYHSNTYRTFKEHPAEQASWSLLILRLRGAATPAPNFTSGATPWFGNGWRTAHRM